MDRDHRSPARQLTLLVAGQVLVVVALGLAGGRAPVAGVPWLRGFPRWVVAAPPTDAVVVVAQRVALVTAAWLLAVTLVHAGAVAARRPRLAWLSGRAVPAGVRRAVAAVAFGAGAFGAVLVPGAAHASSDGPVVRDGRAAPVPTLVAVSTPASVAPAPTIVIVQPGDSLWSIAERVAAAEGGTDVASRWTAICVANAGRLRSGNPAVIYPGEEIVIPA